MLRRRRAAPRIAALGSVIVYGRRLAALSGALALLLERAAALFGTKAAAAERHRATMRRCIVEILLSRSYVAPTSALTQNGERVPKNKREISGGW